jgi:hypothetical protein
MLKCETWPVSIPPKTIVVHQWYSSLIPPESLRFDGENDDAFRARVEATARVAHVLVAACLKNMCMQEYIADPAMPYTVEGVRRCPTVRVEFEQAIAIGGIGECLAATKHKRWGAGPQVMPLQPDDWFYPDRITYVFRESSLYNRRFHQRRRMKKLLGPDRALVGEAKASTQELFLKGLSAEQRRRIQIVFHVGPATFWRAAKGKVMLPLPPEFVQGNLDFTE